MTPQEAENLLDRYVAQQCTQEEENLVNSWFNKMVKETKYPENFSMKVSAMSDDWDRIIAAKQRQVPEQTYQIRRFSPSVAAAVALVLIAIGGLFYYKPFTKVHDTAIAATQDTTISHHNMNFKTKLPDGTIVYLNGASKLRYEKGLKGKERQVFLEGEAYFEVHPDANRPFIVNSSDQQVQVIGTRFNISSYNGEATKTTLVEGEVKLVTTRNQNREVRLKPGFQATLSSTGFEVKKVDLNSVISWRNEFVFNQTPLKNALKELGRWYDKDVDSSKIGAVTLDAVYGKDETLPDLLKEITLSTGVKLVLNNNVITVE